MAELPGNPYAADARQRARSSHPGSENLSALAVAHEQRTANLIALARLIHEQPDSGLAKYGPHVEAEIAASLALPEQRVSGRADRTTEAERATGASAPGAAAGSTGDGGLSWA